MKKFSFSLESLLKQRAAAVDETSRDMAPAVSHYNRINDMEKKIYKQLCGIDTSADYRLGQDYLNDLREVYRHIGDEKKTAEEELQKWQKLLAEKIKEKRIIEMIREKRFREWKKKYNKQAERNTEEVILQYF